MEKDNIVVKSAEIRRLIIECIQKSGGCEDHAKQLADVLIEADLRGHYSHGMNRLDVYTDYLKAGVVLGSGSPLVLKEKGGTAWVDGGNILGPVVGNFCMDLAIQKAKQHGVSWVVCKRSNHFGIAGYYAMRAMDQGLIGMAFTNGTPTAFTTRSKESAFSTNPLSLAAHGTEGDSFVLDMATTTVSSGKIEIAERKGEEEIPEFWGCDKEGKETRNTQVAMQGGCLPLGGSEITGGYKGYGLILMVEIFCALLSDSKWGPNIPPWRGSEEEYNLVLYPFLFLL